MSDALQTGKFYGKTQRRFELGDVVLTEVAHVLCGVTRCLPVADAALFDDAAIRSRSLRIRSYLARAAPLPFVCQRNTRRARTGRAVRRHAGARQRIADERGNGAARLAQSRPRIAPRIFPEFLDARRNRREPWRSPDSSFARFSK